MAGKVVHFEVPFEDGDRARAFYGATFGWELASMPGMAYTLATTGPSDPERGPTDPGFINGGLIERAPDVPVVSPTIVIDVPSVEDALRRVEAAGGKPVTGVIPVGDMGFSAYFTDTEGNLMGLWQTA